MSELQEPSRPANSYWLWLAEHREALGKEAGTNKGPIVGKLAGERWKSLSASVKAPWEKKAGELRAAYDKAMEEYIAAGGQKGKRRAEKKAAKDGAMSKKAKREAKAASGKPKKALTAYWLWLGDNRAALSKELGSSKPPLVSKLAGERWK